MLINIKQLSYPSIKVDVTNNIPIGLESITKDDFFDEASEIPIKDCVKWRIERETKVPMHLQRLIYQNKVLEDFRTLQDYNITDGSDIYMTLLLGGPLLKSDIVSYSVPSSSSAHNNNNNNLCVDINTHFKYVWQCEVPTNNAFIQLIKRKFSGKIELHGLWLKDGKLYTFDKNGTEFKEIPDVLTYIKRIRLQVKLATDPDTNIKIIDECPRFDKVLNVSLPQQYKLDYNTKYVVSLWHPDEELNQYLYTTTNSFTTEKTDNCMKIII